MTFNRLILALLTALSLSSLVPPAHAQSGASPRFLGTWTVVAGNSGGKCQITLMSRQRAGHLAARAVSCRGPLARVSGWAHWRNGFTLLDREGRQIASLSPARGIMTGRLPDGSLVIMRPGAGRRTDATQAPAAGRNAHRP
ncbi:MULTISPECIES: AprI/Inh family metalloprotease inhibitor [Alphaproteobacteria]|nr:MULTISPECIES: AprI/Inh family metalloprotease inhibitor [Alphaproteobacteria]